MQIFKNAEKNGTEYMTTRLLLASVNVDDELHEKRLQSVFRLFGLPFLASLLPSLVLFPGFSEKCVISLHERQ